MPTRMVILPPLETPWVFRLSGMIDNFMTGDTARPDWMVKLMVDNDTSR